jgi:hypothetical protein
MIRTDLSGSLGAANAGGAGGFTLAAGEAKAQEAAVDPSFGPRASSWGPQDEKIPDRQDVTPVNPGFFIPDRFSGRTAAVTGSARGMGEVAARRLAKEGANVVGVDILGTRGTSVIEGIRADGGSAVFLVGDIANEATRAGRPAMPIPGSGSARA